MSGYLLSSRAVRALKRLLRGKHGDTSKPSTAGAAVSLDRFPAPWTVRWSASAGMWTIYLPDLDRLVMFDHSAVGLSGVTALATLPAGWYTIDDSNADTEAIYLVVEYDVTNQLVKSAKVTSSAASASTSKTVYYELVIARPQTSASGAKRVRQLVKSVVTLSMSGEGGGEITVDDVSVEFRDDGAVQIKGWDIGEPTTGSTLAQVLEGEESAVYLIPVRNYDGGLEYMSPGQLAGGGGGGSGGTSGISGPVNIISNVWWDSSALKLKGLGYTWTFTDGVLTAVSEPVTFDVAETVEHSSLHSS